MSEWTNSIGIKIARIYEPAHFAEPPRCEERRMKLAKMIDAAIAAEREGCAAALADLPLPRDLLPSDWYRGWSDATRDGIAAIHARGET